MFLGISQWKLLWLKFKNQNSLILNSVNLTNPSKAAKLNSMFIFNLSGYIGHRGLLTSSYISELWFSKYIHTSFFSEKNSGIIVSDFCQIVQYKSLWIRSSCSGAGYRIISYHLLWVGQTTPKKEKKWIKNSSQFRLVQR